MQEELELLMAKYMRHCRRQGLKKSRFVLVAAIVYDAGSWIRYRGGYSGMDCRVVSDGRYQFRVTILGNQLLFQEPLKDEFRSRPVIGERYVENVAGLEKCLDPWFVEALCHICSYLFLLLV
jgi:hypothetical protein